MPELNINYSYSDVPTIRAFSQSNAFMRGLMGPFGSGKSSGCVIEIMRRARQQAPGPDGIRRTRWSVIRNCYDDQTEILTQHRGWQFFRDLEPDDAVATLKEGALTFEVPSHYAIAPYEGEMLGFSNDTADFLVTPDHDLWTSKRVTRQKVWQRFAHESASAAYGKHLRRVKRDANWSGVPTAHSEKLFEFLGFWFAEGYAGCYPRTDTSGYHYRLAVTQKKYLTYVRNLLQDCGFEWGEIAKPECPGCFNFNISTKSDFVKELIVKLAACGGAAPLKSIPAWIADAPVGHLRAFLHGFLMGDGHIAQKKGEVTRAWTSSRKLADDLQIMALKAGWVANVAMYPIREQTASYKSNFPQYIVTFLAPKRYSPQLIGGWYKQAYAGLVYCVTVSTHVVYVRRNGKAMWCGQTQPQLKDTTIRTFVQWFPPHIFGEFRQQDQQYIITAIPGCEIDILFRAMDRPDQVANLLSLELTGGWVNEAREVPFSIIESLQGRVGRYPAVRDGGCTWDGVILDTNPPDMDSKWYKFFETWPTTPEGIEAGDSYRQKYKRPFSEIFKQPSGLSREAENLSNLKPGYYETLATGKDPEWTKVYVHGQYGFAVDGKPVYPEYVDNTHCNDHVKPVRGEPFYVGLDWGLTPAAVILQMNSFGQLLVHDELVADDMGVDAFAQELKSYLGMRWNAARLGFKPEFIFVGDPAGLARGQTDERTCFQIMAANGMEVEPGLQDLTIRLESVRKPLTTTRGKSTSGDIRHGFQMHSRCHALRKGFLGGYQLRRLNTTRERYTEKPDKNASSHPHDALQYPCTVLFGSALTEERVKKRPSADDDFEAFAAAGSGRSEVTGY